MRSADDEDDEGCMSPASSKCPSVTHTFSIYGGATTPVLNRCVQTENNLACGEDTLSSNPVPIFSTFTLDTPTIVSALL
jgi:hypothetical protein